MDIPQPSAVTFRLKPLDFEAHPIISQATIERLEEGQRQCNLLRDRILAESAHLISQSRQLYLGKQKIGSHPTRSVRELSTPQKPVGHTAGTLQLNLDSAAQSEAFGPSPITHNSELPALQSESPAGRNSSTPSRLVRNRTQRNPLKREYSEVDPYASIPQKKLNISPAASSHDRLWATAAIEHTDHYNNPTTSFSESPVNENTGHRDQSAPVSLHKSNHLCDRHGARAPSQEHQTYSHPTPSAYTAQIPTSTDATRNLSASPSSCGSPLFKQSREASHATESSCDEAFEGLFHSSGQDSPYLDPSHTSSDPNPSSHNFREASAAMVIDEKFFQPPASPPPTPYQNSLENRHITSSRFDEQSELRAHAIPTLTRRPTNSSVADASPAATGDELKPTLKQQPPFPQTSSARELPSPKKASATRKPHSPKKAPRTRSPPKASALRSCIHRKDSTTMSSAHVSLGKPKKSVQILCEADLMSPPSSPEVPLADLAHAHFEAYRPSGVNKENCKVAYPIVSQSPEPSSPRVPLPTSNCQSTHIDFKSLPDLDVRLKYAIDTFVKSWPANQLVTTLHRIVDHRLKVSGWSINEAYQPILLDDLRSALVANHPDKIQELISACRSVNMQCDTFMDVFNHYTIQGAVLVAGKGSNTTVELKRDYTAIGLAYFPLIKTVRTFWSDNRREPRWGEFRERFNERVKDMPTNLPSLLVLGVPGLQKYAQAAENDNIVYITQAASTIADGKISMDPLVYINLHPDWRSPNNRFYQSSEPLPKPSTKPTGGPSTKTVKKPTGGVQHSEVFKKKTCFTCGQIGHINKYCTEVVGENHEDPSPSEVHDFLVSMKTYMNNHGYY
ncbi:hypothetical protein MJO28_017800 [Puccinia striiformis f. sp. tritici]|nr:hypothetical protein MJO28_017800 [Puccinia striiformis f. sp. tritici]